MHRERRSFRTNILGIFGLSMLASAALTYLLYRLLQNYYRKNARMGDTMDLLRSILNKVGDLNFFLLIFLPLAILFFYLFTKPYVRYFRQISEGIHRLASGDFSARIQIDTNDEFEIIAEDINKAGAKLKTAVERGDFAENSKDQLVLNLAHDIRTPLTSVIGYLDFILHNNNLTEEQTKHYMNVAYTKSRRLEGLVEELFEITRMNYGKVEIEKNPLDLSELLVQLSEELYPVFEKNGLTSRLDIPPNVQVIGQGDLLARVFENLLMNAAQYGKDGQFVDIECKREENDVVVRVINYGHWIPEEELPYLFDMFFKGDRSRSHNGGSTGLGLFIARNIAEQHGGTISAQSDITRTVFEVRLPQAGDV
ncbi:sensor histidine kinase [Cohnella thailandensis]|uniref:histidine kinase n=1 Tax=Cohnella thailandensis TaxID=557557 RepID=A0A841T7Q1_9BACL|nr:HAMP domain-containing sensor histidine kinase [Cohnella thailandensis]MBB6637201.1 HAMP domain-containing histidine kinase [Cohnella thailandensis]MBP1976977.1 signal transduction histidine kinase [Cohnella thailandensis]